MAKRIRFATMTLAALLGMPMLAVMIPPGSADAAVTVTYSSFGPGLSFATTGPNSVWCVSGSDTSNCTTENSCVLAVPIVPQATFVLSEVQLPLNYFSGTNTGVVSLVGSIGGVPGGPVLESWSLSNLPVGPRVTTLTSTGGVTLQAGMTYWLEASPTSLTDDTLLVWYGNNRSLTGGLNDISGAGWTGLIPSVLPAYAVTGTQATASSAGAGCTGSNPQTCLPVPPSPAANADLLGSNNEASEAPPSCSAGDPVNCVTGNLTETLLDLSIPGRGRAVGWSRTYNSQVAANAAAPGPLGFGWTGPTLTPNRWPRTGPAMRS